MTRPAGDRQPVLHLSSSRRIALSMQQPNGYFRGNRGMDDANSEYKEVLAQAGQLNGTHPSAGKLTI